MKGQMFSTELVLSSAIFIAGVIVFVSVWNGMMAAYYEEQQDWGMQTAALGISEMMATSPGIPSNWETGVKENASAFGLAASANVMSTAKMQALAALNASQYATLRERMGAGRHEVFMVMNNSSATIFTFGQIGNVSDVSLRSFTAQRLVIANGSLYTLKVQVWGYGGRVA